MATPASPYVVQAGTVIAAALITGIRSDLPGQITAQVTQNVYDSPTGRILLIPQGSKLIGAYDSSVSFGQSRVLLAWTRLILPDGRSIALERQPGADAAGYAGLEDGVNNHWGKLFKAALLSTMLSVGSEAGTSQSENNLAQALRAGAANGFSQAGQQIVQRELNIQPTLTIRPGFPVPVLDPLHMKVIASGLALAARSVSLDHPAIWTAGSEAEINAIVETRLNRLIDEDTRWNQLIDCVVRGKETLSFDGSHLETRPDLSIFLTGRSRAFPLVVECKLIEVAVGKNEGLYCTNGLSRFVTGKYGWGGQEAMMLGYVRDKSTIDGLLVPYLTGTTTGPAFATQQMPQTSGIAGHDIAASLHGRSFTYIHAPSPPGAIAVWHIWVGAPVVN